MKQIVALAMAFAMLAGCRAQPNTPDVTVGAPKEPNNTPVQLPEPEGAAETELVKYELNYVNMSLELPEGWGYAYAGVGVDGGEIHAEPADTVGIRFWPDAAEDSGGGALALYFYQELFGVCGTGLQTQDVTFDSGLTGSMGTYDNGPLWDFISFYDTPGSYVVMNEGAENWWDEYGGQAMTILNSVQVGGELLKQNEAVERAQGVCTVDYNAMRTTFDADSGEWKIWFYRDYTAGGDQTVWITPDGETRTEYGE